jgi:uncharacterized membrane protein (UPF0136 family)
MAVARRVLKVLHLLSSAGLIGALVVHAILLATAPEDSLSGYALVRRNIDAVCTWLLVPSLMVALASGFFAIAVHPPFTDAAWVWIKAALGLPMFEGTLMTIASTSKRAAEASTRAIAGDADPALVADLLAREWNALGLILALAVAQTVLGVWRPRRLRRRSAQPVSVASASKSRR